MMSPSNQVMSVKDLNQMVKDLLEDSVGSVWLIGEISNFMRPASGHWYFSLKDDLAQVRCAMFRNSNFRAGFTPQNGQQVLIRANVTLYEARGEYQLIVEQLQPAGVGLLQQKFEQLKQKLSDEGLFDNAYKKILPNDIRTIGVVTSSTGAALHDICQILNRRDPSLNIIIYPTLVQGNEAAPKIAKMIELANLRDECDALIVGRGGGSLEDLWPFNEEVVARAIFASRLPIVSAVGHEIDFTIADFVADLRAPTPSAAAELVSKDKSEQIKNLVTQQQQLSMVMDYYLMHKKASLEQYRHRLQQQHPQVKLARQQTVLLKLQHRLNEAIQSAVLLRKNRLNRTESQLQRHAPQVKLKEYQQRLQTNQQRLHHWLDNYLTQAKHNMAVLASKLNSVSPLATLERGYTITSQNQHVINSVHSVNLDNDIVTQFVDGTITSKVTDIQKK